MLYFAWVRHHETFDQQVHLRHDEDIFHLKLTHQEGHPARLDLKVSNPYTQNPQIERSFGILSYQKSPTDQAMCLFRGRLTSQSCTDGEHLFIFSLLAQNYSFQEEWATLAPSLKKEPFYTPLCDDGKAESLMASQPFSFYWDRCKGNLGVSHAFRGARQWDLTSDYDPKTIEYEQKEPLSKVSLSLSAQWIQTLTGYKDIGPDIETLFPGKKISTYTPKSLKHTWPKTGDSVSHSGYYVIHSTLEERHKIPFKTPTQRHEQSLPIDGHLSTDAKKTRLVAYRSWFDASLLVGYHYRQKRKENLEFELSASLPDTLSSSKTEHIKLPLQKIVQYEDLPHLRPMTFYKKGTIVQYRGKVYQAVCDHALRFGFQPEQWKELEEESAHLFLSLQSSFFLTAQGRKVFEHALERAKTALTWGTRCTFLHVRGPLCQWAPITLDDTAFLKDVRLPGGTFQGKVMTYTLTADGQTGHAFIEISLAGRLGQVKPSPQLPEAVPSYAPGYTQDPKNGRMPYQVHTPMFSTVRGITFQEFYDQKKEDPLEFLIHSQMSNVVRHIRIRNGPKDQEALIQNFQNKTINPEDLKGKETKINIDFIPIGSTDQLAHTLKPQILSSWFDPS